MKLFVDDLRAAPRGWTLARTVTESIRILHTQSVSEISIDHDIGHIKEVNGIAHPYTCPETFEPVVRYLCAMKPMLSYDGYAVPRIIIHTANATAANSMAHILADAGIGCTIRMYEMAEDGMY